MSILDKHFSFYTLIINFQQQQILLRLFTSLNLRFGVKYIAVKQKMPNFSVEHFILYKKFCLSELRFHRFRERDREITPPQLRDGYLKFQPENLKFSQPLDGLNLLLQLRL